MRTPKVTEVRSMIAENLNREGRWGTAELRLDLSGSGGRGEQ